MNENIAESQEEGDTPTLHNCPEPSVTVTREKSSRRASIQASKKISVSSRITKQPRSVFKHRWLSEEQNFDDTFVTTIDISYQQKDADSTVGTSNSNYSDTNESLSQ